MKKIQDFKQYEVKNTSKIKGGNKTAAKYSCDDKCLKADDNRNLLCGTTDHL